MPRCLSSIPSLALPSTLILAFSVAGHPQNAALAAQPPAAPVERSAQPAGRRSRRRRPVRRRPARPPRPRATQASAAPKVEFEKFRLPNGLQVILHVDRKLPIVHVNQWFHVGSKNEKPGRTGFAHLFEHMMFQGSKNARRVLHSQKRPGRTSRRAASTGPPTPIAPTTSPRCPPGTSRPALARVRSPGHAARRHRQKKLDNQRDVVKNERRQGLENQPYGRWSRLSSISCSPGATRIPGRSSAAWRT